MASMFNRAPVTVSSVAIQIVAASSRRRWLCIQNISANPVAIGASGVAAGTGIILNQNDKLVFDGQRIPTNAIFAIRTGGSDGTITIVEVAEA